MNELEYYSLGIDIGSTTVKIAILDKNKNKRKENKNILLTNN